MIYFFQSEDDGPIKIGVTTRPVNSRLSGIQADSPTKIKALGYIIGGIDKETELHRRFEAYRLHGEWFSPHPDILNFIKDNAFPCPEPNKKWVGRKPTSGDSQKQQIESESSKRPWKITTLYSAHLASGQLIDLKNISAAADLPVSEIIRRMIDYCKKGFPLNEICPRCSGSF